MGKLDGDVDTDGFMVIVGGDVGTVVGCCDLVGAIDGM